MSLRVLAPPSVPDPSVDDDVALLARMARADRAALGTLYDRHSSAMLATAIRVLGSSREAQDLLHDVFLEAWEHAREYDPSRGTVRAWLFVRLRSRALDRMGRASRTRERSIADLELSEELDMFGVASNTDDQLAMKQALSTLSPDVRQALDWTYFEGLTAREIADRAGVPVGTVRSRLARGIAALGAVFEPDGGRDGD